jgi:pyridoxal phosphate enzyme (YggS family)
VTIDPTEVAERVAVVRARIDAVASDRPVRIVAVTKGFGPDAVVAALAAGCTDIGENYAQELVTKFGALPEAVRSAVVVHFIGRLQSNKVRALAPIVGCWQSVDRPSLVGPLARFAPGARVLVQVNVSDEPAKGGCGPSDAAPLVERLRASGAEVTGLMAVGRTGPPEQARSGFRLLRRMADDLGLVECSMGMTDDLEVAVQEGATMVRVGSALFGARPRRDGDGALASPSEE